MRQMEVVGDETVDFNGHIAVRTTVMHCTVHTQFEFRDAEWSGDKRRRMKINKNDSVYNIVFPQRVPLMNIIQHMFAMRTNQHCSSLLFAFSTVMYAVRSLPFRFLFIYFHVPFALVIMVSMFCYSKALSSAATLRNGRTHRTMCMFSTRFFSLFFSGNLQQLSLSPMFVVGSS